LARDPEAEALVGAYRADLEAVGKFAGNPMISPARSFLLRVGEGFSGFSLSEQCSISEHESRLVTWLIVTRRLHASVEYLVARRLRAGRVAAWVHRGFHERFMRTAAELGFVPKSAELQWWAVAIVAALVGVRPERLTSAQFDSAREQLIATTLRLDPDRRGHRGGRSAPRARRALQASSRRAAEHPRPTVEQALTRRRAGHAADLP
jgi:hypothetical protein